MYWLYLNENHLMELPVFANQIYLTNLYLNGVEWKHFYQFNEIERVEHQPQ